MNLAMHMPRTDKLRGKPLLLSWLGGIVAGWGFAYLFARLVIWIAHAVFG